MREPLFDLNPLSFFAKKQPHGSNYSTAWFIRQRDVRPATAPATNANQQATVLPFRNVSVDRAIGAFAVKSAIPYAVVYDIVLKQRITNRHPVCNSEIFGLAQLFELLCNPGLNDRAVLLRSA